MRASGVIAALLLLLAAMAPGATQAAGRYASLAVDANTGQILHAEAADEPRYPASLTKMMTLYLVFELLEQGRLKPETRIVMSPNAADTPPSKLGLPAGQSIALGDAVKALITKSANDIAVAIAEHIAGDEATFAALMTQRAREIGLKSTTFHNAHGLPDNRQVTTARDMVMLGLRLYDHFPAQARLFALRAFSFNGRSHRNHNTMLDNYAGMDGLKTGYTRQSGFNLVASVRRDGRHVIAAVLGGETAAARNARMRVVLDRALVRAGRDKTRRPEPAPFRSQLRVAAAEKSKAQPHAAVAAGGAPKLVEPVRAAKRPYMAEAAPATTGWRSTVRLAAPMPVGSSTASLLARAVPGPEPSPQLTRQPVQVVSVRTIDVGAAQPAAGPSAAAIAAARRPSTLQAQAQQLDGAPATEPPPARVLARPATGTIVRAGSDGSAEIQIGAFTAEAEARQRLEAARQHSAGLLGSARTATPTISVGGKRLYRARFTGLDARGAAKACIELRRHQVDCLVTKAE
ncbi:MAG: serine hydrolase [Hyphomicrobiaceae bacterium]|nr:serine hydrolase [Hyphomicrobiaceae bacterium]